jgi:soluble lytic murein transglycosylase-like protein
MTPPTKEDLIALAKAAAIRHMLAAPLVCAVVEQESGWNAWAVRYEPAFRVRYVAPLHLPPTLEVCCSISWGLMQLMGQCAIEDGYPGKIPALCDPATGLEWGCVHLVKKISEARGDPHRGLELWNGGGNKDYADQVFARVPRYQ